MKKFKEHIKAKVRNEAAVKRILDRQYFWCDVFEGHLLRFESEPALNKFENFLETTPVGGEFYSSTGSDIYGSVLASVGEDNAFDEKDLDAFEETVLNFNKPPIRMHQVLTLINEVEDSNVNNHYKMIVKFMRPHVSFPYNLGGRSN